MWVIERRTGRLLANLEAEVLNAIELWKAIHGGCWPGPPPDRKLTETVGDVIAALAVHNIARSFQGKAIAATLTRTANESLQKSLPNLQKTPQG
jgi:hypothetical protein